MQASKALLGICFISLWNFSCHAGSKFDRPKQTAQVQDIKPDLNPSDDNSDDAEAQKQALEPVAIGGAYLNCQYNVIENDEVWCRLEENKQPIFTETSPMDNWVFMQDDVPMTVERYDLDRATGWQWGIKLPKNLTVSVSLDIFVAGVQYHFDAAISTKPKEDKSGPSEDKPANKYAYGGTASFIVDNNPFSTSPPASCVAAKEAADKATIPDPTLPNLRLFLKAQKFIFPFKVLEEGSLVTIGMDEICGQLRPIHFAELTGMGLSMTVQIPVGAKKVIIAKDKALPVGEYEVMVHFVPRNFTDLSVPERFAFGKLILESQKQLDPGFAYGK